MSDLLTEDQIVYDPVTAITRAERRALLGISGLGVAIAKIPLVPTKIAVLGIDFTTGSQSSFLQMYNWLITFFLIAFVIYAATDFVAWRRMIAIRISEYERASVIRKADLTDVQYNALMNRDREREKGPAADYRPGTTRSWDSAFKVVWLRVVFEFIVPVVFALYSMFQIAALSAKL